MRWRAKILQKPASPRIHLNIIAQSDKWAVNSCKVVLLLHVREKYKKATLIDPGLSARKCIAFGQIQEPWNDRLWHRSQEILCLILLDRRHPRSVCVKANHIPYSSPSFWQLCHSMFHSINNAVANWQIAFGLKTPRRAFSPLLRWIKNVLPFLWCRTICQAISQSN